MPVILSSEHYDQWLDPGFKDADSLPGMLKPFDACLMKRYPVSSRVNRATYDDPECAAEVSLVSNAADDTSTQLRLANIDVP